MKITDQPTEYVLIRTVTQGNWDPNHFAVLHLTAAWVFIMRQRLKALEPVRKDKTFYSMTYWDEPMGYYCCDQQDEIGRLLLDMYLNGRSWCFISLDDPEEYLGWHLAENRMVSHMMTIGQDCNSSYMCFSRVEDFDFATEPFSLRKVLGIGG
jgi:hypothetical protein